jgi:ATP-dependent helicase/nuclease subunit B
VSDYFRPDWPEARHGRAALALETIVRRRQQPSGRASLVEHIERLAARAEVAQDDPARARDKLGGPARQALPLLLQIAAAIDALPERATYRQWGVALKRLALDTGLLRSAEPADDESRQADSSAWQKLAETLAQSERMATWLEGAPAQLSRRQLLHYLEDALRSTPWESTTDEAGRVRVLGAESARHVTAPYVFVAGLSEMSFPPAQRDDCIYSDAETRELVAAGLPLVSRADRRRHEMLLFYQVVTRPTRQLVLSYPALDESAQPMTPSPYLAELARLFGPDFLKNAARPDLRVVPASDEVYSADELRVRATAQALDGEPRLFGRLVHHAATSTVAANVLAGVQLVNRRAAAEFGSFEGLLSSDAARAALLQRYGPDQCWSTSRLEQYAYCPYQFFIERVLGLRAIEDPALSVDYQQRGRMLHWLLAEFHRRLNAQHGLRITPSDLPGKALDELMASLLDELAERAAGGGPLAEGLIEVDLHRVTRSLAGYWQQHVQYDSGTNSWDEALRPAHFEVAFGPQPGGDVAFDTVDVLSTSEPFYLDCEGERVCFSGRIDRIDVGRFRDQTTFGIIDYKSGRSESANVNAIVELAALQLPIYALAAEQLLTSTAARPYHVSYWHVAGKGVKQSLTLGEPDEAGLRDSEPWKMLKRELPGRIAAYLRGIRQGAFPVICADDKCTSRCDYHTVCRVNQIRSLDKQWQPPRGQQP